MWIMMLVLVTLSTGEEKAYITPELIQYPTEAECMASFDREPVLWGGYEMKVKCVQLGIGI